MLTYDKSLVDLFIASKTRRSSSVYFVASLNNLNKKAARPLIAKEAFDDNLPSTLLDSFLNFLIEFCKDDILRLGQSEYFTSIHFSFFFHKGKID